MENVQINDGPDLRLDFMGSFIQKTLKLKPEKWQRLLTFEEHKTVIKVIITKVKTFYSKYIGA